MSPQTLNQIDYQPPSPAEFRATRYWINRNVRMQSVAHAGAAADLELELWLNEQDQAKAAALLEQVAA